MFAQLVGKAHAVGDEILAGATGVSQSDGGRTVGSQRSQPGAIGTQRVSQYEGVEAVVLVTGRAVASAKVLDLLGLTTTTVRSP